MIYNWYFKRIPLLALPRNNSNSNHTKLGSSIKRIQIYYFFPPWPWKWLCSAYLKYLVHAKLCAEALCKIRIGAKSFSLSSTLPEFQITSKWYFPVCLPGPRAARAHNVDQQSIHLVQAACDQWQNRGNGDKLAHEKLLNTKETSLIYYEGGQTLE